MGMFVVANFNILLEVDTDNIDPEDIPALLADFPNAAQIIEMIKDNFESGVHFLVRGPSPLDMAAGRGTG